MKRKLSSFVQLLKRATRFLLLLITVAVLLNGFLTMPVFATGTERAAAVGAIGLPESVMRSAMPQHVNNLFQSVLPTQTFTPTPAPPTNTPTPAPPTNTPTPAPPTNTPTPAPPTNTPTPAPPTDTPTPVSNQPPHIDTLSVPSNPVHIGQQPVVAMATFGDPDAGDTHVAEWSWGDGTVSTCPPDHTNCVLDQASDIVSGSHSYTEPGIYAITLTITDQTGNPDKKSSDIFAVYDPDGGFVTGSGWIYSDPGWCKLDHCTTAEGKAAFGFVSRYKRGAYTPGGHTKFTFQAGNLNFQSDSYQWLVLTEGGTSARFKGWGTINGALAPGGVPYQFMLWAGDGEPDTFRIKISYETPPTEVVVYDTGADQPLQEGAIVIHDGK